MEAGTDRLQEERHNQNLQRFRDLDADLRKNSEQTGQALKEVSSVRHGLGNFRQLMELFMDGYQEDKLERKKEMKEQATEMRKLSNRFIWAMGLFTGLSIAANFISKLLH